MKKHFADAIVVGAIVALLGAMGSPAFAKSSDRGQDMRIQADNADYTTDGSRPSILVGNVAIEQGTLDVRSGRAEITHQNGRPARVVLTGGRVQLKQQLDSGGWVTAAADKVDYDLNAEIATLTGNVQLEQSGSQANKLTGQRVVYNMKTGRMNAGEPGKSRVNIVIPPKAASTAPTKPGTN
jgi:lipopolysaccharide export system protein LptA